jgi:hypothetical protein
MRPELFGFAWHGGLPLCVETAIQGVFPEQ